MKPFFLLLLEIALKLANKTFSDLSIRLFHGRWTIRGGICTFSLVGNRNQPDSVYKAYVVPSLCKNKSPPSPPYGVRRL